MFTFAVANGLLVSRLILRSPFERSLKQNGRSISRYREARSTGIMQDREPSEHVVLSVSF